MMVRKILVIGVVSVFLLTFVCCKQQPKGLTGVTYVKVQDVPELLKKKVGGKKIVPLDVRTPAEYNSGHIKGAINVDYRSEMFSKEIALLKRDVPYLVYCRSGARSTRALKIIHGLGFKVLYHMDGGMLAWYDAKLPSEK